MEIGKINHGVNMYGGAMQDYNRRKRADLLDSRTDKYFNPEERSQGEELRGEEISEEEAKEEKKKLEESATDTDIVVKPDGSRVLVVTTHIGGMSATVSMKISEPTKMPNESKEIDTAEEEKEHVGSWNEGAGDFIAGPERGSTHAGGV